MVTKLAPALLASCTVVMKPASPTPLLFRIIVDAATAAGVPAGVVNYVTGPGRMGDLMVRHPKVAKVAFTGSTPVGHHIAGAPQCDPLDPARVFGSFANQSQYKSVLEHLYYVKQEGARFTVGGQPAQLDANLKDGLFIQPRVLVDVTPDMRVAREEIFGPVIMILKYDDVDETISLAKDTEFGLGGIVFGTEQDKTLEVAEATNTGSVGINFFASHHAAPSVVAMIQAKELNTVQKTSPLIYHISRSPYLSSNTALPDRRKRSGRSAIKRLRQTVSLRTSSLSNLP